MDLDAVSEMARAVSRFERFGYWRFYEREEAERVVEEHVSSPIHPSRNSWVRD